MVAVVVARRAKVIVVGALCTFPLVVVPVVFTVVGGLSRGRAAVAGLTALPALDGA